MQNAALLRRVLEFGFEASRLASTGNHARL
jgi:hypothetical protein